RAFIPPVNLDGECSSNCFQSDLSRVSPDQARSRSYAPISPAEIIAAAVALFSRWSRINVLQMRLYCLSRNTEDNRDLLVGLAFRKPIEDFCRPPTKAKMAPALPIPTSDPLHVAAGRNRLLRAC